MYVGFSRFLMVLVVVGVGFGAVFGLGVAVGKTQKPATVAASTSTTAGAAGAVSGAATAAASGGAAAGQGGGLAGFGGSAGGGAAVNGSVDAVTATSMTVRTATGESVTLTLNPQTTVRKIEAGAIQDIKTGDQVLVTRDASSVATTVQVVPPGTTLGVPGVRGGGTPTAGGSATPSASGTPRRGPNGQ